VGELRWAGPDVEGCGEMERTIGWHPLKLRHPHERNTGWYELAYATFAIYTNAVGLRQRDEVFDIDMPNIAGFLIKDGALCRRRFIPIWQGKRSTWIGHEFIDDALGFSRNSIYDVI
jgi:hypothetical protein